jgi:site-specific DNA-methyltransferase (adenine-specific)
LDPCVKSGVFLREIVERLNEGLKLQIPDDYERLQHILENQVFGIALEEIGGLIARRTIYCSRKANDKLHTICCTKEEFAKETNIPIEIKSYFENSEQGNIIYKRCEHSFKNGSCIFCGASEKQ